MNPLQYFMCKITIEAIPEDTRQDALEKQQLQKRPIKMKDLEIKYLIRMDYGEITYCFVG